MVVADVGAGIAVVDPSVGLGSVGREPVDDEGAEFVNKEGDNCMNTEGASIPTCAE